jgi:hypothetical protein
MTAHSTNTSYLPFWVSQSFFITNSVAQEPEDSSPNSQQPAIGPCPEPVESNPHPPSQSQDPFWSHLPTYALVFRVFSFLRAFPPKPCTLLFPLPTCYMPCPPHSPWLDLPNDIWGWVQIMKFLTVQLSPFSHHLFPLRYKYSSHNPQTPSVYALPLVWQTKFHTHTKQLEKL